jgi:hypothetical protein
MAAGPRAFTSLATRRHVEHRYPRIMSGRPRPPRVAASAPHGRPQTPPACSRKASTDPTPHRRQPSKPSLGGGTVRGLSVIRRSRSAYARRSSVTCSGSMWLHRSREGRSGSAPALIVGVNRADHRAAAPTAGRSKSIKPKFFSLLAVILRQSIPMESTARRAASTRLPVYQSSPSRVIIRGCAARSACPASRRSRHSEQMLIRTSTWASCLRVMVPPGTGRASSRSVATTTSRVARGSVTTTPQSLHPEGVARTSDQCR